MPPKPSKQKTKSKRTTKEVDSNSIVQENTKAFKVAKKSKVIDKLVEASENGTLQDVIKELVDKEVKEIVKEEPIKPQQRKISFIPDYDPDLTVQENLDNVKNNPGKQARFLSSKEDEVLYAGGRGSAKSTALIIDPLPWADNGNFRALIIRRTMPELRELISRAQGLYKDAYPNVRWNEQEKIFKFPSGAKIEFGYCDNEQDLERYRGQEFQWIGIDEIAQFPGPWIIDRLKGSLRTTDRTLPVYMRFTCNPVGAGRGWIKKRFKIRFNKSTGQGNFEETFNIPVQTPLGEMFITRKWFHSTVYDNKVLIKTNPMYVASLASQSNEALRAAELEGSWEDVIGLAFPEFDEDVHIVQKFDIPAAWYKWRACDWGYSSMAVCLWFAMDWDNNIYVYRELATKEVNADEFGHLVKELESEDNISVGYLASDAFSTRGQIGETPGDTLARINHNWVPSDRSANSRKASKLLVHRALAIKGEGESRTAKMHISVNCKELIEELGTLTVDPGNPEDIDLRKKYSQPDHAYDALRYGLQGVPDIGNQVTDAFFGSSVQPIVEQIYEVVDSRFGY